MFVNLYVLQTEITTSSGRRVKKRNLDECDGNSHNIEQHRRSRNGQKRSKKKSVKASRPQRRAARNALTLFSKIKGSTSDQDEYCSEGESSVSESALEDSNFEGEESDMLSVEERGKNLKGKEVIIDNSEDTPKSKVFTDSYENSLNTNRLVLKLPVRDSDRALFSRNSFPTSGNLTDLAGSSSSASGGSIEVDRNVSALSTGFDRLGWPGGYGNYAMKWGGVKARLKRVKLSAAPPLKASGSCSFSDNQNETDDKRVAEDGCGKLQEITDCKCERLENPNGLTNANNIELSDINLSLVCAQATADDKTLCSRSSDENNVLTLGDAMKKIVSEPNDHSEKTLLPGEGSERNMSCMEQRSVAEELEEHLKPDLDGDTNGGIANACSTVLDSQTLHLEKNDRMYSAVYRRSRSLKAARTLAGKDAHMGENASSSCHQHLNGNTNINGHIVNGFIQTNSAELRDTAEELFDQKRSMQRSRRTENSSPVGRRTREEGGSSMTVGLRSTRNRRINFVHDASPSPMDRRKSSQSQRKLSWLMLSVPDYSRYIPQHGDEVAYLRQVIIIGYLDHLR